MFVVMHLDEVSQIILIMNNYPMHTSLTGRNSYKKLGDNFSDKYRNELTYHLMVVVVCQRFALLTYRLCEYNSIGQYAVFGLGFFL